MRGEEEDIKKKKSDKKKYPMSFRCWPTSLTHSTQRRGKRRRGKKGVDRSDEPSNAHKRSKKKKYV